LKTLDADLEKSKDVFRYMGTNELPNPDPKALAADNPKLRKAPDNPRIKEAVKAAEDRQPGGKIWEIAPAINRGRIRQAIEPAERQAAAFDRASKPVEDALKRLSNTVRGPLRLASLYHAFVVAVEPPPGANSTSAGASEKALKAVTDLAGPVSAAANELNNL